MNRIAIAVIATLASACATQSSESPASASAEVPAADAKSEAAVAHAMAEEADEARIELALTKSMHAVDVTEVVLEPRGKSALTIDDEGGVRLWPDLHAADLSEPWALPIREPVWMSLAETKGGFVAAFIDTAGAAKVGRIAMSDEGARWIPTFEIPPMRPMFELHVIDGGQRVLGLGVDHRITLWDTDGNEVAEIDQPGFVPWQLRISQPKDEAPKILAVLAGPVSVQPITLKDDKLAITGEPRAVALDRGPNRNDLAMSPDGKVVTALRRPKARGKRFELEIIDIASGERKIMAAESDERLRPRVHPIDSTKVMMESGSGQAFYVDFEVAQTWPPVDAEPDREAIPESPLSFFSLAASSKETRVHSAIADGIRVVPVDRGLTVAKFDQADGRKLAPDAFAPSALALDATGDRVAWGTRDAIVIDGYASGADLKKLPPAEDQTELLAFAGEQIVVVDTKGRTSLRDLGDGKVLATAKIDTSWGPSSSGWRPGEGGAGHVALSTTKPSDPARILPVQNGSFGELIEVPRDERATWPEAGKPRKQESREWLEQLGMDYDASGLRKAEVLLTEPDPSGRLIAVVQKSRDGGSVFDSAQERWVFLSDKFVVTMFDWKANKRLWTREVDGVDDMAWSGDGKRFGFIDSSAGGFVCDAENGSIVHERHDLGLSVR